jgi:hypothetical protein
MRFSSEGKMNKARSGKNKAKHAEKITPVPARGTRGRPAPAGTRLDRFRGNGARKRAGAGQPSGKSSYSSHGHQNHHREAIMPYGFPVSALFALKTRPMAFCYVGWSQNGITIRTSRVGAHPPNGG